MWLTLAAQRTGAYRRAVVRELSSITDVNVGAMLAKKPQLSDRFAIACESGRKGGMSPEEVASWISLSLLHDQLLTNFALTKAT